MTLSSYGFHQWCRPEGKLRVPELAEFVRLMREALGFKQIYWGPRKKPIELAVVPLQTIMERKMQRENARYGVEGVSLGFYTAQGRDPNTYRFDILAGHPKGHRQRDAYDISLGNARDHGWQSFPDLRYFERSIEAIRPYEAFITEHHNEWLWNSYERQQQPPGARRPALIRWFHYLDREFAMSLGGMERCLKAPVWRAARFCDGVLLQLFPEPLDPDSLEHLDIQSAAMEYFGLPPLEPDADQRHHVVDPRAGGKVDTAEREADSQA